MNHPTSNTENRRGETWALAECSQFAINITENDGISAQG
jgi:hypothetical protein